MFGFLVCVSMRQETKRLSTPSPTHQIHDVVTFRQRRRAIISDLLKLIYCGFVILTAIDRTDFPINVMTSYIRLRLENKMAKRTYERLAILCSKQFSERPLRLHL